MPASKDNKTIIRVSSKANVHNLASSLQTHIVNNHAIEVDAVGAGAVNQAVKAISVARASLCSQGYEVLIKAFFKDVMMDEVTTDGEGKESKITVKKSCICLSLVVSR